MTRDGSVPSNFLTPKIRKLAKNWCTLAYIVRVCCGNCSKRFYLVGEYKFRHLILGVLLP